MTTQLAPLPVQSFRDSNGNPLAGGLLYTYSAGTSTPLATYTDSTGATPNANPIVLNSRGEANLWLTTGQSYKLILQDASANLIWSVDQVGNAAGVASAAAGANSDILSTGNNTSTIYTTAGTATAYTITPVPAYTAYAIGMSVVVNFALASGASPTIAWNGIATPPQLVKENADGTYSNIAAGDIPINHRSRVTLISATQALVERLNGARGWELVSSATASASATIDFTGFSGTDDDYMVSVRNCVTATDDSGLYMRVSQAGAFKTDATYNYAGLSVNASATTAAISGAGGTQVQLTGGISSTAVEGGTTGDVEVSSCSGAAAYKTYRYDFEYFRTAVGTHHNKGGGAYRGSAAAVDGIRLFMSAGNITSGTFLLYKRRKT